MTEYYADATQRDLIDQANQARQLSYSPYSHFQVGAALVTDQGKVYTGCNVESSAYSASNCAERTAFFKAVSQGERQFSSMVVVGGKEGRPFGFCPPCGVCRQVMMEFCSPDHFLILLANSDYLVRRYTLGELLPEGFGPDNLC